MSLETYTSNEIPTFIDGRAAGLSGIPYNDHADSVWQDGWRWGAQERRERRQSAEPPDGAVSVFELLSAAYSRACLRPFFPGEHL
jgi:hypothetical protein